MSVFGDFVVKYVNERWCNRDAVVPFEPTVHIIEIGDDNQFGNPEDNPNLNSVNQESSLNNEHVRYLFTKDISFFLSHPEVTSSKYYFFSFSTGFISVIVSQIQVFVLIAVLGADTLNRENENHWIAVTCNLFTNTSIGVIWLIGNHKFRQFAMELFEK